MTLAKLPWNTGSDEDAHMVYDDNLDAVAECLWEHDGGDAANAEFIVLACNLHDELVKLCLLAYDVHDELFVTCGGGMKTDRGKPIDCTKINELGSTAQGILRKLELYPKLLEDKLAAVMAELKADERDAQAGASHA